VGVEAFESCERNLKIYLKLQSGEEWVRATSMNTLFEAIQRFTSAGMKYRVVAGNTGTGTFTFTYKCSLTLQNSELQKNVIEMLMNP
jgi:hypothetical protein